MDEITIDVGKLHDDLLTHFGNMRVVSSQGIGFIEAMINNPTRANPNDRLIARDLGLGLERTWSGALGDIDTMFETGDYQGLVDLALHEGFELADYEVT